MARKVLALLAQNINGICVLVGLVTICASVAQWSGPAAGVIGGSALAAIGLWPYLRARQT